MLLVGRQERHPACKKTEQWNAGVVICLERDVDLREAQLMPLPLTVSCFSEIQIGFTFLVLAHLGSPRQRVVKWVCVRACVRACLYHVQGSTAKHFDTELLLWLYWHQKFSDCPSHCSQCMKLLPLHWVNICITNFTTVCMKCILNRNFEIIYTTAILSFWPKQTLFYHVWLVPKQVTSTSFCNNM